MPQNLPTALHWLHRAAVQGREEAWRLIGHHVGYEYAQHSREAVLPWYERAWEAGVLPAGLVLAQLVLLGPAGEAAMLGAAGVAGALGMAGAAAAGARASARGGIAELRAKAMAALDAAAQAGLPDALRLQAQQRQAGPPAPAAVAAAPDAEPAGRGAPPSRPAQPAAPAGTAPAAALDEASLGRAELAARGGDRDAQLALGLWFARMDRDGARLRGGVAAANFKRAIRWLTPAGEQGLAEAWFALFRIYSKPEFSQRSASEAQACLERAADMGHSAAQLECGIHAWRTRRGGEDSDVRAAYWLQKAAGQGCAEAEQALRRIAPAPAGACWADGLPAMARAAQAGQPLLAARLELAALFGLTRAEALLLDVRLADRSHCLLVDIRASYGRGKRRLVPVSSARQRQALDRAAQLFDAAAPGAEGNYRQRLYRLKTWLAGSGAELEAA